jgi:DNA polymerase III subunit gamma/tau
MSKYQVIARKYRPQTFAEVVGQEAIVQTLKNAIRSKRLAHAYLFCGSRGTGKTTLARVLAKAVNCENLSQEIEPCNACTSCREIAASQSIDVLEIDGASHRGIDDIRQINDTVGYATAGHYKIYLIDEVHMLTKEAFNALLKTLEEPPENVKFFFATTEPHKVLPTILSRCQRFNLNRIPQEAIVKKLKAITSDLGVAAEEEALHLLAKCADGGLRDAESLLDQILVFHDGQITAETVSSVLGIVTSDLLFEIDAAGKEGRLAFAFEAAHQIFSQGKDLLHFIESLVEHFRNLLLVKLCGENANFLTLSENERAKYAQSAKLYTKEQCLNLLEYLIEEQNKVRFMPSPKIALETILLHVMRIHQRLPIEVLVRSLNELEEKLGKAPELPKTEATNEAKALPKTEPAKIEAKALPKTEAANEAKALPKTEAAKIEAKAPELQPGNPEPAAEAKAPEMPKTEAANEAKALPKTEAAKIEAKAPEMQPGNPEPAAEAKAPEMPKTKAAKEAKALPKTEPVKMEAEAPELQPGNPEPAAEVKAPELPKIRPAKAPEVKIAKAAPKAKKDTPSLAVDPTPTPEDLGIKTPTPPEKKKGAKITAEKQSRYDTLMHFAAVELEGTVQKG